MKKILIVLALVLTGLCSATAQILEPVKWTAQLEQTGEKKARLVVTAQVDNGWHVYAMEMPEDGPRPTTLHLEQVKGGKTVGKPHIVGKMTKEYDENFEMTLQWYSKSLQVVQDFDVTGSTLEVTGSVNYMTCNDQNCLPPTDSPFSVKLTLSNTPAAVAATEAPAAPADKMAEVTAEEVTAEAPEAEDNMEAVAETDTTATDTTVAAATEVAAPAGTQPERRGLWGVLLAGLLGGFLALFTPCVWPIIPMTVSYFLKRSKDDVRKGRRDATLYGLSIVVIYVSLGLLITLIFGASALNQLATSAVFNLIFFGLLILFAVSFFGAFELTLPASWSTKLDEKAESTGGVLGILFMAFTLVLVSFSCTGPIIGTLLVETASNNSLLAPTVGMLGFALALAIPFSFFAFFPNILKKMPKSGGWMNSLKVVLAFLETALSLKFLSVADLAYGWHILDRETFVALWIVIFALLGIYLLGKIRFPHDDEVETIGVPRFFMALISLAFAVYMIPGLWGAPLKAISAFAPPLSTQDFNLYEAEVEAQFMDYDEALRYAQQHDKPLVVDFSGYGCVNCRKMEAAVWTDPAVAEQLQKKYVLVSLMVDDKTELAEPIEVEENGQKRVLKTVGDKWSYLQRSRFGANAQPYYVKLSSDGTQVGTSYSFNEDARAFLRWLTE